MKNSSTELLRQSLTKYHNHIIYGLVFITCVAMNLMLSYFIKLNTESYIQNTYPFNLKINILSLAVIISFITYGLIRFGIFKKFPMLSLLILTGSWSNFLERLIHGYVADYIPIFQIAIVNIADLQIWVGLILLNLILWVKPAKSDEV